MQIALKFATQTAAALVPSRMAINRRLFLAHGAATALAPFCSQAREPGARQSHDRFFVLEAKPGEARLRGLDNPATGILGYDGVHPAPTVRIRKGEELRLRLRNGMSQATSLHIRGMRGPNAFDGVPPLTQEPLAPGATQDIRFTPPDSGVFYFHPHGPGAAEQAARGLGGVLIVEEEKPPPIDHEFILAIADWRFGADGELEPPNLGFDSGAHAGRPGALLTINGAPAPLTYEATPGARIRLRIINMGAKLFAALTFAGVDPLVAGVDAHPCKPFEPIDKTLPIGPGGRFDIFFDMPREDAGSAKIVLRRWPVGGAAPAPPQEIVVFTATGARRPALPPLQAAPDNPALPPVIPLQRARRADLTISNRLGGGARSDQPWAFHVGAKPIDLRRPLLSVKRGTPVALGFLNKSDAPQLICVHGHAMRQLHLLDDGWEPYWRDSVIVPEGRTARVAFLADNPGRWRVGSGVLADAESGLSTWIEVT